MFTLHRRVYPCHWFVFHICTHQSLITNFENNQLISSCGTVDNDAKEKNIFKNEWCGSSI